VIRILFAMKFDDHIFKLCMIWIPEQQISPYSDQWLLRTVISKLRHIRDALRFLVLVSKIFVKPLSAMNFDDVPFIYHIL